jgi:hypothetical protein
MSPPTRVFAASILHATVGVESIPTATTFSQMMEFPSFVRNSAALFEMG